MVRKRFLVVLLLSLCIIAIPFVQATTITSSTFDKDIYYQGETGYIEVTIYNDKNDKIRITELTATIDHYYVDGNDYYQRFFTEEILPSEIPQGESRTFTVPFSLPTIIASGYVNVYVKAVTQIWNAELQNWSGSEQPTDHPLLYVESPYKEQLDEQTTISNQLEDQLDKQTTINQSTTTMMYMLGATTIVFAAVTVFLFINRGTRAVSVPMRAYMGEKAVNESKKIAKEGAKSGKKSVKKTKKALK